MSSPIHAVLTGSFTSDGATKNIALPSGYDSFEMINITDIGSTEAASPAMRAQGTSVMSAGSAYYNLKTSGAATNALELSTTSGGFTFIADSAGLALGPLVATSGTDINRANPAVVSTGTTTNLVDSVSVVRLINNVGMLQISGMDFTVGTIIASTSFQLKYLNNSGFAADSTSGFYRIVNASPRYYPRNRFITAITAATSAVVTLSVTHGFTAGQTVRFVVPSAFGMTQMDGLLGTITAVSTANNTITVNIDSSAFTAFAFPTSATAATGVTFAQVVPVGEAASSTYANLLDDATDNVSFTGVSIGTTVQTTGKVYQWFARKGVTLS
jgi:hypothetical protein